MFVENMEFECDVLVWHIFVEYGLTCEIVCEIYGSELEDPGCVLLLVWLTCKCVKNHVDICLHDVLTWIV